MSENQQQDEYEEIKKNVFITETKVSNVPIHRHEIKKLLPVVSGASQLSQSTLLMKKRKELREIDDALEYMKEDYAQRMEACSTKEQELARKQLEMKEQIQRFDKFIKENESKCLKAEARFKSERRSVELNELKRKQLKAQLEKDLAEKEALQKQRDQLLQYKVYLEATVEFSDGEYEEIGDMLNRHAILVDTKDHLTERIRSAESETEQLRQNIRALQMEMQNLTLNRNSEIHRLQQKLEHLRSEVSRLDLDLLRSDKSANNRNRQLGEITMTITNLFDRCRHNLDVRLPILREGKVETAKHLEHLLQFIATRITDLDYIAVKYRELQESYGSNVAENISRLSSSTKSFLPTLDRSVEKNT
uniref:Uncharacterized protein AlNc14C144G7342 n=1 Tax=Albugo laibachii Nc14 TaxID=890382 RepID=F0WLF4_9STRA|nr:conserved hypothetical protein [Albugo laibachii Nc14]CCA23391.1 conserved hypothetical protein [Albugo laibachii Nc14]|eukprot:CCA23391.1 conserved hypothetical protein [Albugo laibachii Nc14]